jgi:HD-like signal output (HDOD) protein
MADYATGHAGIELDFIDLSSAGKHSLFQRDPIPSAPKPDKNKLNYKNFVKNLLTKILTDDSFLSFSVQIHDVNEILSMKYSSADDIAAVILKDVALTTKLLKLVNSSFYGQFSHKGIATISEAMIILGTDEIKLAAANLKIYELMHEIANIKILKDMALKAMQQSIIARQIAIEEEIKNAEAIQISALLYNFGEYLVALFSPEAFINIEIYMDENRLSKEKASKSIIGISYSEIGRFVASKWKLPSSIIRAMKPVTQFNVDRRRLSAENFQQYICAFANELCNVKFSMTGNYIGNKLIEIAARYDTCLKIPASKSVRLLKMSRDKLAKYTSIVSVNKKA